MVAAWIALVTGVLAAVTSGIVAFRQERLAERMARLAHELETEQRAAEILRRYREPLAAAAFDLQGRLYNILRLDFFGKYGTDRERSDDALRTTLFRLTQYFGWTEILRRDIQFLSFPDDGETRRVAVLQTEIARRFPTDSHGTALMIWRDEQRAMGETMIVEEHGKVLCMGYARFLKEHDPHFAPWLDRLRTELHEEAAQVRLREVQHLLCELVETLDPARIRYVRTLQRA